MVRRWGGEEEMDDEGGDGMVKERWGGEEEMG